MYTRSRSLRRRRHGRGASGNTRLAGLATSLRRRWGETGYPRRGHWSVLPLLALGLMAGLLGLAPPSQAAPRSAAQADWLVASPPSPPATAQWTDPSGAIFVVQLAAGPTQGNFSFTLSTGDTMTGTVPITGPDASGLETQSTSAQKTPGRLGACAVGMLVATTPYPSPKQTGGSNQPTTDHQVYFLLQARFDANGLVAFAHLSYADPARDSAADAGAVQPLCFRNVDSPHAGTVVSGCPDLTSPCAQPVQTAVSSVQAFDSGVIAAESSGDWSAVYGDTTELLRGQYSEGGFAAAVEAQFGSAGKLVSLSQVTTSPQVQFGTVGEPFFSVLQTATISKGGKTSTRQITSYFLLEQGVWHFWFSS